MMSSEVAPGMPMNTRAKNLGASLGADFGLSSRDIMRVGAEYQNYRYNDWWPPSPVGGTGMMAPDTFLEINDGRRDRADAYVEWDRAWTSAWTSQVGVRSDTVMMDTGKVHGYNAMYDAPPLFAATTVQRRRSQPGRFELGCDGAGGVHARSHRDILVRVFAEDAIAQSLRALLLVA